MSGLPPAAIAAAYEAACRAELSALKPGNVHVRAAGHRMTVDDFTASAAASAPAIALPLGRVGARILAAIRATRAAVGTNTNLGIVLLCAPLAAAAEADGELFADLREVLAGLDRQDAADAFAAIRLASPGGLGTAPEHDVAAPAAVDLRTAMAAAAARDRIANAYADGFADIAGLGLPRLAAARNEGLAPDLQTCAVFLAFLAGLPDTHIARKHGPAAAVAVAAEAAALVRDLPGAADAEARLLAFDASLKKRGLNPGTSADFTVATLFADRLISEKAAISALSGA